MSNSCTGGSRKEPAVQIPPAKVVVGVDFGTTFSGFAFAHVSKPADVNKFLEWPDTRAAGVTAFCKTQTSLYYKYVDGGEYVLSAWGWPAQVAYRAAARAAKKQGGGIGLANKFLTKFKLRLAGQDNFLISPDASPPALTAERLVTDYLREMKNHIMKVLQLRYGEQLTINEVQWCLTVPSIWTDDAKLKMTACAEKAGLVQGHYTPDGDPASPHPITIVLEPEAAALACWKEPGNHRDIARGEHLLVADIGGGTVDIVVHEKVFDGSNSNDLRLKEVAPSSGGLYGGSFVDVDYLEFLGKKIPCFKEHVDLHGTALIHILKQWHEFKSTYDGGDGSHLDVELPSSLTTAWKQYDRGRGATPKEDEDYDELHLTNADLKSVFDPNVDGVMRLIRTKLSDKVKVLMVVGGFSASPYLMARIKAEFGHKVKSIVNPNDPGAAICCGAVEWVLNPRTRIVSRIAKESYGVGTKKVFDKAVHPKSKRIKVGRTSMCRDLWNIYVTKGQEVDVDYTKSFEYGIQSADAKTVNIPVYCTSELPAPTFTDDDGVSFVCCFKMDVSDGLKLGQERRVRVSMQFGHATIEVKGQRLNFGDTKRIETFKFVFEELDGDVNEGEFDKLMVSPDISAPNGCP